jgi:hypothetical protein
MNLNYIIGLVVVAIIIIGSVIFFTPKSTQNVQTNTSSATGTTTSTSDYQVVGGSYKKYPSPNGEYIAISASDEQGNSAINITDANGKALTPNYCGFYDSWSSDSTKIKVLLPPECGYGNTNQYYYLDVNGTRKPIEGSTFVPTAQ